MYVHTVVDTLVAQLAYVVPAIAQHNGMALYIVLLLSTWYNVAACVVVL